MSTISEIKQRAKALAEKTDVNSVTPKDVGGIMYDLGSYGEHIMRNGGTLGIRKVYASIEDMEADNTNPVDLWGDPIKKGNLVVIYDGANGEHNNEVYAFLNPGWKLATNFDAGYAMKAEVDAKLSELGQEVGIVAPKFSLGRAWAETGSTNISILPSTTVMYAVVDKSFMASLKTDYEVYVVFYKHPNGQFFQKSPEIKDVVVEDNALIYLSISRIDGADIDVTDNPFEYFYTSIKRDVEENKGKIKEIEADVEKSKNETEQGFSELKGSVEYIGQEVGVVAPEFALGNPWASDGSTSITITASTNKMYFVVPSHGFMFTLKSGYAVNSEFKKNADGTYTQNYVNKDCFILEEGETMHICIRHTDDSDISVDENPFDRFIYGLDFQSYINKEIENNGLGVFKAQSSMAQGVYYVSGGAVQTASSTKNLRISSDKSVGFKLKDGYKLVTAIIKRVNNVAEIVANSETYFLNTGESLYLTFSKNDETQDLPGTEQIVDYWYYGKSVQIDINKQNIEAEALLRQSADDNIDKFIGRTALVPVFALGNPWASAGSSSISILSSTTVMYTIFANSFKYKLKSDYKVYSLYKKSSGVYNQVYSNDSYISLNSGDTMHFAVGRVDGQNISISESPFEYIYIGLKGGVEDNREKASQALDYISNIPAEKVTFSQGSYYNNNGVIATTNLTTRQRILIEESCAFVLTSGIKVYTAFLEKTDQSIERVDDTNLYTVQTGEKLYLSFSALDDTQDILVNNIKPITVLYKKLSYEVFRNRKDIEHLGEIIGGIDTSVIKNQPTRKLYLGRGVTPSLDGASYGSSWSVENGEIVHTGTDWTQFVLNGNYENGKKYFITITHNSYGSPIGAFDVAIGNGWFLDPYNGGDTVYCGLIGDGGLLKFRARGAAFKILSIAVQEVLSEDDPGVYEEVDFQTLSTLDENSKETDITGFWNVAVGPSSQTFAKNINGTRNVAIGRQSMLNFQSGSRNVSIGTFALSELRRGECNVAIGADAMWKYQQAEHNIAIGRSSLSGEGVASNVVPLFNVAIGTNAISNPGATTMNTIGIGFGTNRYGSPDSVFIGHRAGLDAPLSDGGNVVIGAEADAKDGSNPVKNAIAIGKQVVADKDNQVKIGNANVTEVVLGSKKLIFNLDGSVSWETVS